MATRRLFNREFKLEAVKMINESRSPLNPAVNSL
jgi:hypothetical protein